MVSKIESVQNEKIKNATKLAQSSKARNEQQLFFLEGLRLCGDVLNSSAEVDSVFFTVSCFEKNPEVIQKLCARASHAFEVSAAVFKKLTQTQTPQGVCCLVRFEARRDVGTLLLSGRYIALENIQDPANLGAICRTAEALGVTGAVLCHCCDVYNPKTLRASMGSILRLPLYPCDDLPSLLLNLQHQGMRTYATTPDASAAKITECSMSGGTILVIGNEGNGVSEQTLAVCEALTIPMLGRAESLNASMAAAIAMWEMMKQESER